MAKSNGFWGKSCAGFAGRESAHGARANVHGQRSLPARVRTTVQPCGRQRSWDWLRDWKTLVVFVLCFISH